MRVAAGFVSISCLTILSVSPNNGVEGSSWSFTKATFIPPAKPPTPTNINHILTTSSSLSAKKKSSAPAASKKIQVKLLKHVAGTGQAGDVVMVTPPFFNNKLRPTKSATLISDEQVQLENDQAALAVKEQQIKAASIKERVEAEPLLLKRKAGPEGHLFGGVGAKTLIEELKESTGEIDFLDGKSVKITALMEVPGQAGTTEQDIPVPTVHRDYMQSGSRGWIMTQADIPTRNGKTTSIHSSSLGTSFLVMFRSRILSACLS